MSESKRPYDPRFKALPKTTESAISEINRELERVCNLFSDHPPAPPAPPIPVALDTHEIARECIKKLYPYVFQIREDKIKPEVSEIETLRLRIEQIKSSPMMRQKIFDKLKPLDHAQPIQGTVFADMIDLLQEYCEKSSKKPEARCIIS